MKLVTLHVFCAVFSFYTHATALDDACIKPKCYLFTEKSKHPIKGNNENTEASTVFCFEGLQKKLWHLWANPVFRISRPGSTNESSKFMAFYGDSVSDVDTRSQQHGYALMQKFMSSMRSMQQNEDLSLNPFNQSCYKILTDVEYTVKLNIRVVEIWYLIYLAVGVVIFFSARTWSHNTTLHYGSGVSLGIVASMIILVFILLRILPAKLKNIGYVLFMLGTSASFYFWYMVNTAITTPAANTLLEYWQYLAVYILVMGVISFAIVYRYGPVTDDRTLSLIQWLMQFVGLVLVYNSTQLREVSCALVILLITIYNFPRVALKNQTCKNIWYKLFPPRIKLLTEDEYICQGNRETKKELEKLRDYCRSPDCKAWKVISKLQDPHRFAEFVEGDSWHVTNDELLDYDSGPDPVPPHLVSDDDDESDMDFALASP